MSAKHPVLAKLASSPDEYQRLGINQDRIEPSEDGMRTDGSKGTFEWWYFDAHLDDGSKLVITFNTKEATTPELALGPFADVNLDRADGTHVEGKTKVFTGDFWASTDGCDVRMGPNLFMGDLHTYTIHVETETISVDVTLSGTVPAWRPETGHFVFEDDEDIYFAWLPSVPQGRVEASITVDGETTTAAGVGYHDHNWGNASMMKLINNWYWGRGQAGPYSAIACYLIAEACYGFTELPIFMLAKDGKVIADDSTKVAFTHSEIHDDPITGKPVADLLTYRYTGGVRDYVVTWRRKETILTEKFIEELPGFKRLIAQLIGFDGSYMRFTGDLAIEVFEGGALLESEKDEAIWELMYFGKNRED